MSIWSVIIAGSAAVLLLFQNCAEPLPNAPNLSSTQSSVDSGENGTTTVNLDCTTNEVEFNGQCVATSQTCPIQNGIGSRSLETPPSTYGVCSVVMCNNGYHPSGATCAADVIGCTTPDGGSGTKTWNGSAYGSCVVSACTSASQHVENNVCVANAVNCSIDNGQGQKVWNGSGYSSCNAVSCNANYHLEGGLCLTNTKSCSVPGGNGIQTWNPSTSTYGACTNLSCQDRYVNKGSSCVGPLVPMHRLYKIAGGGYYFYWTNNQSDPVAGAFGFTGYNGITSYLFEGPGADRVAVRLCVVGGNFQANTTCPDTTPLIGYLSTVRIPNVAENPMYICSYTGSSTSSRKMTAIGTTECYGFQPTFLGYAP